MSDSILTTGSYDKTDCSRYNVLVNVFLYPYGIRDFVFKTVALKNSDQVLDAGCGYGVLSQAVQTKVRKEELVGVEQHAFDISWDMLKAFKDVSNGTISLLQSDVRALPYRDNSFDLIVTSAMLEYVPNIEDALAMLKRCLKPRGRIFVFMSRKSLLNTLLFIPFGKPKTYKYKEFERLLARVGFRKIQRHRFPFSSLWLNVWGVIIEATK